LSKASAIISYQKGGALPEGQSYAKRNFMQNLIKKTETVTLNNLTVMAANIAINNLVDKHYDIITKYDERGSKNSFKDALNFVAVVGNFAKEAIALYNNHISKIVAIKDTKEFSAINVGNYEAYYEKNKTMVSSSITKEISYSCYELPKPACASIPQELLPSATKALSSRYAFLLFADMVSFGSLHNLDENLDIFMLITDRLYAALGDIYSLYGEDYHKKISDIHDRIHKEEDGRKGYSIKKGIQELNSEWEHYLFGPYTDPLKESLLQ